MPGQRRRAWLTGGSEQRDGAAPARAEPTIKAIQTTPDPRPAPMSTTRC
jgi:hypothetical protein